MHPTGPLEVLLIPLGSAGDVHPLLGLASRLSRAGHRATVMTSPHFEPLVRRLGLELIPLGTAEEFDEVTRHPDLWHPRRGIEMVIRWAMLRTMRPIYETIRQRYVPGRTVVVAQSTALGARLAREKFGVPLVTIHLQPAMLRSLHAPPKLPPMWTGRGVPRWLIRWQFFLADRLVVDPLVAHEVNAFRAELGLPRVRRLLKDWWHSPDRVVGMFPAWFAAQQPDWPPNTVLTSFPLWDEAETRDELPELTRFLADGPPPIVFTPGSAMRQGGSFFAAAVEACQRLQRRGLLLTPYREQLPRALPDGVRHFDFVPFSQVLPQAAAVVHHGGVGTVAQSFSAGVPQLIMPMSHDQPDNADRVTRLGVGRAISPRAFRGPAVAAALASLLDTPGLKERCCEVAQCLRGVDGLALTVHEIETTATAAAN